MSKKKVVVALGHEALGSTIVEQLDAVKKEQSKQTPPREKTKELEV